MNDMKATTKSTMGSTWTKVCKGIVYFLMGVALYCLIDHVYVDVKHAIADALEETR